MLRCGYKCCEGALLRCGQSYQACMHYSQAANACPHHLQKWRSYSSSSSPMEGSGGGSLWLAAAAVRPLCPLAKGPARLRQAADCTQPPPAGGLPPAELLLLLLLLEVLGL